jgi:hypothetical protein
MEEKEKNSAQSQEAISPRLSKKRKSDGLEGGGRRRRRVRVCYRSG